MKQAQRGSLALLLWCVCMGLLVACGSRASDGTAAPVISAPAEALTTYCDALKSQDFATAYDQLASTLQRQLSKDAFAQLASRNIASCIVSLVQQNGTAATGQITYTFTGGGTSADRYSLINENGQWKISQESTVP